MLYNSYQFLVQIPSGTTKLFLTLLIREGLKVARQPKPAKKPHQSSFYDGACWFTFIQTLMEGMWFPFYPWLFRSPRTSHFGSNFTTEVIQTTPVKFKWTNNTANWFPTQMDLIAKWYVLTGLCYKFNLYLLFPDTTIFLNKVFACRESFGYRRH